MVKLLNGSGNVSALLLLKRRQWNSASSSLMTVAMTVRCSSSISYSKVAAADWRCSSLNTKVVVDQRILVLLGCSSLKAAMALRLSFSSKQKVW